MPAPAGPAGRQKKPWRWTPHLVTVTLAAATLALWLLTKLQLRTQSLALAGSFLTTLTAVVQLTSAVYQRSAATANAQQDPATIVGLAAHQLCSSVKGSVEDLRQHLQLKVGLLDVRWVTLRSDAADVPPSGNLADLVAVFRRLPVAQRRLLILGGPASGKTVYAASLVLGLLETRGDSGMIPVLLRYALRENSPDRDIVGWMVDQVEKDYSGTLQRESLFDSGPSPVVPVLDGVDEVGPLLSAALTELDESHHNSAPLVLVCRSDLYRQAVQRGGTEVANAWVIELRPLAAQAVADYLGPDPRWRKVAAEVTATPPSPLSLVLRNPFYVWLAKRLFRPGAEGAGPDELLGIRDEAALRRLLLTTFVPTVLAPARRPHRERFLLFTMAASTRWLRFLAGFLHRNGEDDLAWWELRRMIPPFTVELAVGALAGVSYGTLALLVRQHAVGIGVGAFYGVVFGFGFCLSYTSTWRRGSTAQRAGGGGFRDNPFSQDAFRRLAEGTATVVVAWLVALALVAVAGDPRWLADLEPGPTFAVLGAGMVLALLFGVVVGGIAAALLRAMTSYATLAPVRATTPNSALARDRRATAVCYVMFVVVLGVLTAGSLRVLSPDPWLVGFAGVGGGLAGGVTGVMMFFAWPAYEVRHAWLALWRRLPWRYMTFLDTARKAGVLRQSGAHHQFRHRIVRDFLGTQ